MGSGNCLSFSHSFVFQVGCLVHMIHSPKLTAKATESRLLMSKGPYSIFIPLLGSLSASSQEGLSF